MLELNSAYYKSLFDTAYPFNYIIDAYLIIQSIVSIILISSLFLVISKQKWSNLRIDLQLMTIMIAFDLGGGIICLLNGLLNLLKFGNHLYTNNLCNLNAFLLLFTFITSINIVGVLSLERCLLVVYKKEYPDKLYYWIIIILFFINLASWLICWFIDGFTLMPSYTYCMFNVTTTGGIIGSVFCLLSCGISDTMVFICYPVICIYRRNQSRKAQLELGLDPAKVKKEVNTTILKSLALIVASGLTNGPYCILFVITWFDSSKLTPAVDMVQVVFMSMNTLINSLILLNLKPELWKSLKELWGFKQD